MAKIFWNFDIRQDKDGTLEKNYEVLQRILKDDTGSYVITNTNLGLRDVDEVQIHDPFPNLWLKFRGLIIVIDSRAGGVNAEVERIEKILNPAHRVGFQCSQDSFFRACMNLFNVGHQIRTQQRKAEANKFLETAKAYLKNYAGTRKLIIDARNTRAMEITALDCLTRNGVLVPTYWLDGHAATSNRLQGYYRSRRDFRASFKANVAKYREITAQIEKNPIIKSIRTARKFFARQYDLIQQAMDKGVIQSVDVEEDKGIFKILYTPIAVNRRGKNAKCIYTGYTTCECKKIQDEIYYIGRVEANIHTKNHHPAGHDGGNPCQNVGFTGLSYQPGTWHHPHVAKGNCGTICLKDFADLHQKNIKEGDIFQIAMTIYEFLNNYNYHSRQSQEADRTHMLLRIGEKMYEPRTIEPIDPKILADQKEAAGPRKE